ncbi:MAG TPA: hypothetical protein VGK19_26365 [Capsulimonadaceae bacterium]|jgi:hypothetical protein
MTLTTDTISWTTTETGISLHLAPTVDLDFTIERGMLAGLAQATVDGVATIAPGSLRLPHVETRDGWVVTSYQFVGVRVEGGEAIIDADAIGVQAEIGRRLDMFQFAYLSTPRRKPTVLGKLAWHIKRQSVPIGCAAVRETRWMGFSYSYELSLSHPFHWILDAGTWELGGDPEGVTVFSQHMAAIGGPMEQTMSRSGKGYTSAETFEKGSSNNADVFHDYANDPNDEYILPIQAQLRGAGGALFDLQHKGDSLLLCYYDKPGYYRTLVEWRPDADGIGHLDQIYFSKTQTYVSPEKYILMAQRDGLSRVDAFNLWTDVYDAIADSWRAQKGIPHSDSVPGFGTDCCGGAGVHIGYGPADMFDQWEKRLGWLSENGFQTFFIAGFGNHRGHDMPFVANMCQPYDYRVHARYGGPERFRQFCNAAHAHGIKVATWFGAPYTTAPVFKKHPDWMLRYDSGAPWDGNYGTLCAASLRRGFHEWLMDEVRYLQDLGLDHAFFDSYHNLWAMAIDFTDPDLHPQFMDLVDLQADMERIGVSTWVESFSPFGVTAAGFWPQYARTPELSYDTHYRCMTDDSRSNDFYNGNLTAAVYFRMLANKSPIGMGVMDLDNAPFAGDIHIPDEIGPMNRTYNALLPTMRVRTLNDDSSVLWTNPTTDELVLFAVCGSATVPDGFRAVPVYGEGLELGAGKHQTPKSAAYRLVRQ